MAPCTRWHSVTLRAGIFVVTSYRGKVQTVESMTSTSFEAMPIGLLLYELQNLICDFAVADWVEGNVSRCGHRGTRTLCLPPLCDLSDRENWPRSARGSRDLTARIREVGELGA